MAFVVIGLMVAFIGGTALQNFLESSGRGLKEVVAYYKGNQKITRNDLLIARQELEILQSLHVPEILRSIIEPTIRKTDLRAYWLGQILFQEKETSGLMVAEIRRLVRMFEYQISLKQINDMYKQPYGNDFYWFLLKKEAQAAGLYVSNEDSGRYLATIAQALFPKEGYAALVRSAVERHGLDESKILQAFGKLLAVLEYGRMACTNEDITTQQVKLAATWDVETASFQFVRFDANTFAKDMKDPTPQQISEHFDKYKAFFAGDVTDNNPYGFGYKLPDMVQLEYVAVKMDDIAKIVPKPTPEEAEEYYIKNKDQFNQEIPADPNDPNSKPSQRLLTYAEVAADITKNLYEVKKNAKAETIIADAKELAQAPFENAANYGKLTADELKKMAAGYNTIAEQLSKKYAIKVYAGQTGLLGPADIREDKYLSGMFIRSYTQTRVGLAQVVFAVDELGVSELGPFDAPTPKTYENIGPVRDFLDRAMIMVRITGAQKAVEPQSIDQTISKTGLVLDPNVQPENKLFVLKQKVAEDVRKLEAMPVTKTRAEEFRKLIAQVGWDDAIKKFNELYGPKDVNETDPNKLPLSSSKKLFTLESPPPTRLITTRTLDTYITQSQGNPAGQLVVDNIKTEKKFIDMLFALVPPDANSLQTIPHVLEFKPLMSCYCLKSLSINRINEPQYEQLKTTEAYTLERLRSQGLSVVHFNPENITKRMAFRMAQPPKKTTDSNTPPQTAGES